MIKLNAAALVAALLLAACSQQQANSVAVGAAIAGVAIPGASQVAPVVVDAAACAADPAFKAGSALGDLKAAVTDPNCLAALTAAVDAGAALSAPVQTK